jgi:holin-like protein
MESETRAVRRPAEVTVVVVLTYISAIGAIVFGVLLILARYGVPDSEGGLRTFVTIAGAVVVLIGFLIVAIASGIARGDRAARLLATVFLGLSILASVVSAFVDTDLWSQIANAVIGAAAITVMWTGRASRFFGSSRAVRPTAE